MSFSASNVFFWGMLSTISGMGLSSFFHIPLFFAYEIMLLGFLWALLFFKNPLVVISMILLISFGFGLWYGSLASPQGPSKKSFSSKDSSFFQSLKTKLQDLINTYFSPPYSSILSAVLLGNKNEMSRELKEKLNRAGVRHITAISGMHIVILSQILLMVGIALGLYRGQAFYFAVALIWLFIIFTGWQASAIRAGILGTALLFCQKVGRQASSLRIIVLAAFIMLFIKPSLWHSISFQLSFSASLGITFLLNPLQKAFNKIKGLRIFNIPELLALTLSAQIFTLPFLVYHFGYISLVAPLSNILIVPILPFLMGGGFLFLLVSLIAPFLGLILSFPVYLLLYYLTGVVNFFAALPFSVLTLKIPWFILFFYYGVLGWFVYYIQRRSRFFLSGY